jgi:hypothetical protein
MSRATLMTAMVAMALMVTACSGRQQQWETARRADTLEAYQNFLQTYPDGEFASQAQARVRELQESTDWQKAMQTDTADAYQQFVNQHPQGRMADEARIRLGNFALAQTPSNTPSEATAEAGATLTAGLQLPATKTSASTPASTSPSNAGAYRIQLGAFSGGDKQAMGEWRRLQAEYPQLLGGLSPSVKLATTPAGHLYRLQAGMLPEANARQVCATLKADNQACIVVPP